MIKKWLCFLFVLSFIFLLMNFALAQTADEIRFGSADTHFPECIDLIKQKGFYYLYLPACWDSDALVPYFKGESLTLVHEQDHIEMQNETAVAIPVDDSTDELHDAHGNLICKIKIMQGSLPSVFITLPEESLKSIQSNKRNEAVASMEMFSANGDVIYSGQLSQMKIRGNTTASYPKKPYQIKLNKKTELIENAGKAKTWVLLADYLDLSLIRNRIALDMARFVGLSNTPHCQSVDLYINQKYCGVYLLCEKVQIGSNRVDINDQEPAMEILNDELDAERFTLKGHKQEDGTQITYFNELIDPEDITGGYLVVMEKKFRVQEENKHSTVLTKKGFGFIIREPSVASENQTTYVAEQLAALERAIYSKGGIDAVTGKSLSQLVDLDSFVLKCLLEDVSDNFDAKSGSLYFYKDSDSVDSKWYAGPAWDYDLAFYNGLQVKPNNSILDSHKIGDSWWAYMYKNSEEFQIRASTLYEERFLPALRILLGMDTNDNGSLRSIDEYLNEISDSVRMNFTLWPYSGIKGFDRSAGTTHETSVSHMRKYIEERMNGLYAYYCQ